MVFVACIHKILPIWLGSSTPVSCAFSGIARARFTRVISGFMVWTSIVSVQAFLVSKLCFVPLYSAQKRVERVLLSWIRETRDSIPLRSGGSFQRLDQRLHFAYCQEGSTSSNQGTQIDGTSPIYLIPISLGTHKPLEIVQQSKKLMRSRQVPQRRCRWACHQKWLPMERYKFAHDCP